MEIIVRGEHQHEPRTSICRGCSKAADGRGSRCVHKAPGSVPTLDNLEQGEEAGDTANS